LNSFGFLLFELFLERIDDWVTEIWSSQKSDLRRTLWQQASPAAELTLLQMLGAVNEDFQVFQAASLAPWPEQKMQIEKLSPTQKALKPLNDALIRSRVRLYRENNSISGRNDRVQGNSSLKLRGLRSEKSVNL
jgi:hypothetical protein